MPIPNPPPTLAPIKALNIVKSAMLEINVIAFNATPSGSDGAWGLEKLQRLIDKFNAQRELIFAVDFNLFTLIPNHAPHTIGPTGGVTAPDFAANPRPVKIESAAFILNSASQPVDVPIHIRDAQWWASNPVKSLQSSICTDLFYSPDVPLGNLNFWPIANVANQVRLEMWFSLTVPINLATVLVFPQGYWDAIVLSLACEMCSRFGKEPTATLAQRQKEAMRIIMGNNATAPRIDTGGGMPNSRSGRIPDFDFLTGLNDNY